MLLPYIFALLWVCITVIRRFRSPISKIPGPKVSLFTGLFLKYHELTGNRRLYIHDLHKRYGPAVRVAPNEVSFANLEAMKEIYTSGGSGYNKTEFYSLFQQFNHRTMFSTLDKHEHAKKKRRFADRYAMTNVMKPDIIGSIQERANGFIEKSATAKEGCIDVYVLLHCYSLDCVSHFLFGSGGTDSINAAVDFSLMQELSYDSSLQKRYLQYYSPWLASIFIGHGRQLSSSQTYVLNATAQPNLSPNTVNEKLHSKVWQLQEKEIAAECMDHLAAGIDTTGDGLCFLLWQLSQPENIGVQTRLQLELSNNPTTPLNDLLYLDAVVKESLRCFPPIPMSLPRYVPSDGRIISGYQVSAGTIVSCQAYSINRLEQIFPEPDRFWPERWLEDEGIHDRNRAFFSFAAGGRGCVGKNLALTEMKVLLREIYLQFTTRIDEQMNGDMDMDDQIIATRPKHQTCLLQFNPIC